MLYYCTILVPVPVPKNVPMLLVIWSREKTIKDHRPLSHLISIGRITSLLTVANHGWLLATCEFNLTWALPMSSHSQRIVAVKDIMLGLLSRRSTVSLIIPWPKRKNMWTSITCNPVLTRAFFRHSRIYLNHLKYLEILIVDRQSYKSKPESHWNRLGSTYPRTLASSCDRDAPMCFQWL